MSTYYNGSGYRDKTAAEAINNVSKQEKETQKAEKMMTMVDTLLDIFEFELVVELKIKNKKTGKVYKR